MSQRINVRLSDSRRGSQAFIAIVAILLLAGAGAGVYFLFFNKTDPKGIGGYKPDPDKQAGTIYTSFTDSLTEIAGDPAKLDEELKSIKKLNDTDAEQLKTDFAAASPEMKAKVLEVKKTEGPKLTEAYGKAIAAAGVKDKLEPAAKPLLDKLDAIK